MSVCISQAERCLARIGTYHKKTDEGDPMKGLSGAVAAFGGLTSGGGVFTFADGSRLEASYTYGDLGKDVVLKLA